MSLVLGWLQSGAKLVRGEEDSDEQVSTQVLFEDMLNILNNVRC